MTSDTPFAAEGVGAVTRPDEMLNHLQDWLDNPFTQLFKATLDERMAHNVNALVRENTPEDVYRIQGACREIHTVITIPELLRGDLESSLNLMEEVNQNEE